MLRSALPRRMVAGSVPEQIMRANHTHGIPQRGFYLFVQLHGGLTMVHAADYAYELQEWAADHAFGYYEIYSRAAQLWPLPIPNKRAA